MKGVLWKVAKRLSYIQDARCLKVIPNTTEMTHVETKNNLHYTAVSPVLRNKQQTQKSTSHRTVGRNDKVYRQRGTVPMSQDTATSRT